MAVVFQDLAVFDIVDPAAIVRASALRLLDDGVGAEMFELDDNVARDGFGCLSAFQAMTRRRASPLVSQRDTAGDP